MRKFLLALAFAALASGCAVTFDGLEFDRYVTLHEHAVKLRGECGSPYFAADLASFKKQVDHIQNYNNYRRSAGDMAKATNEVASMTNGLYNQIQNGNEPSVSYCQVKVDNLIDATNLISTTLGGLQ